jgi:hypothetical protein
MADDDDWGAVGTGNRRTDKILAWDRARVAAVKSRRLSYNTDL